MEIIRDALDTHDIDDYCDVDGPEPEEGIYCIECGWKGKRQAEANLHLAKMAMGALVVAGFYISQKVTVVPDPPDFELPWA